MISLTMLLLMKDFPDEVNKNTVSSFCELKFCWCGQWLFQTQNQQDFLVL
jgi:hypothetical protein